MADTHVVQLLDINTANQIAAGEVVEKPASVVKELVENALDAGASQIDVTTFGGGTEYIRVVDNGCGMSEANARLAVLRHATSKIVKAEDLMSLKTLGFRGEALPSIRLLAKELRISVITTKRAYDDLEQEGFIHTMPGKGSFVAPSNPELYREQALKQVEDLLGQAVEAARKGGVSRDEVQEILTLLYEEN